MIRKITSKLDIIANELEKKRPDLALALDFISDKLEKQAAISAAMNKLYKQYQNAGGTSNIDHFLREDIPGYLKFLGKNGSDIWEWDKSDIADKLKKSRQIGDRAGKINAPTFAYQTLYGKNPPEMLNGRTRGKKKIWHGLDVDEGLKDEWLEKLNNLPIEMRSSEEGKSADRPAFVIIRMPKEEDDWVCDMTFALRKEGLTTSYGIGQGSRPRICIVEKLWRGMPEWEAWWKNLPDKISRAYKQIKKRQ